MPNLFIISGCNGSGKTTCSYTLLPELLDCKQFVNSDEFAKSLNPFDPNRVQVRASRYMLLKIKYLLSRKETFAIETTLATRSLLKTITQARNDGYHVYILYFWLNSPEMAVERVAARVVTGGHNIPTETIYRRYRVGLEYFFNDYAPACDRWILADNSNPPFKVVAEGTNTTKDDLTVNDDGTFANTSTIESTLNVRDEETYKAILKQLEQSQANK